MPAAAPAADALVPAVAPAEITIIPAAVLAAQQDIPREWIEAAVAQAMLSHGDLVKDAWFEVPLGLYEEYFRQTRGLPPKPTPPPVAYLIDEAVYALSLSAQREPVLTARLRVVVLDAERAKDVPLLPMALSWQDVKVDGQAAQLAAASNWLRFYPSGNGTFTIEARVALREAPANGGSIDFPVVQSAKKLVGFDSPLPWELVVNGERRVTPPAGEAGPKGAAGQVAMRPDAGQLNLQYRPYAPPAEHEPHLELSGAVGWNLQPDLQQVLAELVVRIVGGPARQFELALPPGAQQVKIEGPDVRDAQLASGSATVFLRGPTRGQTALRVRYELPPDKAAVKRFGELGIRGATWGGGTFVVTIAGQAAEVLPSGTSGLAEVSLADLPEAATSVMTGTPALVYRIESRSWSAGVEVVDLSETALRESIADLAHFELVYRDDGTIMGRVSYEIRNRTRQFLLLKLPPGTRVLQAKVNEKSSPLSSGGAADTYLLPLVRSKASLRGLVSFPVEVVYLARLDALDGPRGRDARDTLNGPRGQMALPLPQVDVPIAYAWCEAYLPPGLNVEKWSGPLKPVEKYSSETAVAELGYGRGEAAEGYTGAKLPKTAARGTGVPPVSAAAKSEPKPAAAVKPKALAKAELAKAPSRPAPSGLGKLFAMPAVAPSGKPDDAVRAGKRAAPGKATTGFEESWFDPSKPQPAPPATPAVPPPPTAAPAQAQQGRFQFVPEANRYTGATTQPGRTGGGAAGGGGARPAAPREPGSEFHAAGEVARPSGGPPTASAPAARVTMPPPPPAQPEAAAKEAETGTDYYDAVNPAAVARNYWRSGRSSYDNNDFVGARRDLEKVVELAPGTNDASNALRLLDNIKLAEGKTELKGKGERAAGAAARAELGQQFAAQQSEQLSALQEGLKNVKAGQYGQARRQLQYAQQQDTGVNLNAADPGQREVQKLMDEGRKELAQLERLNDVKVENLRQQYQQQKASGDRRKAIEVGNQLRVELAGKEAQDLQQELEKLAVESATLEQQARQSQLAQAGSSAMRGLPAGQVQPGQGQPARAGQLLGQSDQSGRRGQPGQDMEHGRGPIAMTGFQQEDDVSKITSNKLDVKAGDQLRSQVRQSLSGELAQAADSVADGKLSQEEGRPLQERAQRMELAPLQRQLETVDRLQAAQDRATVALELKNASPEELAGAINRMYGQSQRSAGGRGAPAPEPPLVVAADGDGNRLLASGSPDQIAAIRAAIQPPDQVAAAEQPAIRVFPLRHGDATDLAKALNALFDGARGRVEQQQRMGAPAPPAPAASADERTNALVVSASAAELDMIRKLIEQLDTPVGPVRGPAPSGAVAASRPAGFRFVPDAPQARLGAREDLAKRLPQVQSQEVETTVSVPDGGTLLIGGQKPGGPPRSGAAGPALPEDRPLLELKESSGGLLKYDPRIAPAQVSDGELRRVATALRDEQKYAEAVTVLDSLLQRNPRDEWAREWRDQLARVVALLDEKTETARQAPSQAAATSHLPWHQLLSYPTDGPDAGARGGQQRPWFQTHGGGQPGSLPRQDGREGDADQVTRTYDINDLVVRGQNVAGPRINLAATTQLQTQSSARFSGTPTAEQTRQELAKYQQTIKAYFQGLGREAPQIRELNGQFVVTAAQEDQKALVDLLDNLRRAGGPQVELGGQRMLKQQASAGNNPDATFLGDIQADFGVRGGQTGGQAPSMTNAGTALAVAGTVSADRRHVTLADDNTTNSLNRFLARNYDWAETTGRAYTANLGGATVDGDGTVAFEPTVSDGGWAYGGQGAPNLGDVSSLAEKLRFNRGQKVVVNSVNVDVPASALRQLGIRLEGGVNGLLYATIDPAQFRSLVEMETQLVQAGRAPVNTEQRAQETIVGTGALLANGMVGNVAFAGDYSNSVNIAANPLTLPHGRYLLISNGSYVTVVRSSPMQNWLEAPADFEFAQVPQTIELPRVGQLVKFEKTLIQPADELVLRATYQWKGNQP